MSTLAFGHSRPRVLRAELRASRRTFTWASTSIGAIIALYCIALAEGALRAGLATDGGQWDANILAWLSFYPSAFALPTAALTGALAQWRAERWREGGALWRPIDRRRVLAARCLVLSLACLTCQVILLALVLAHALTAGQGWGPVERYLPFTLLMWVGTTGAAMLGVLATRWLGGIAVGLMPAGAFVWSMAGALQAESAGWLARPWTWLIRGTLPLLGVHGNSVSLEADSPIRHWPWWPAVTLQVAVIGFLLLILMVTGRGLRRGGRGARPRTAPSIERTGSALGAAGRVTAGAGSTGEGVRGGTTDGGGRVPSGIGAGIAAGRTTCVKGRSLDLPATWGDLSAPRPLRAGARILPWGVWNTLAVLLLTLVAVVRAVYSPDAALSLLCLVGIPVAASVVGVMTWTAQAEARRILLTRLSSARIDGGCLILGIAFLTVVTTLGWGLAVLGGGQMSTGAPVYALLTAPAVLVALTCTAYVLCELAGLGVAIVVSVLGLLTSLVVAGNEALVGALWPLAPWGWSAVAAELPQTWLIIVGACLIAGVLALAVAARGGRHAALRAGS